MTKSFVFFFLVLPYGINSGFLHWINAERAQPLAEDNSRVD
jgi:hypothetical protein